jgi:hypothetical protein
MLTDQMPLVDFANATFRVTAPQAEHTSLRSTLAGSLVYRPALFRRNEIRWIAACAWRSRSRVRGLKALKQAKEAIDPSIVSDAAILITTLIREIFGNKPVGAISCVPCGHSRRTDCFGKQLAQSVAIMVEVPFVQVYADRPCPGASHPKQSVSLPPLQQIADPAGSMIIIDDIATSGWHLQETMLPLRRLGVAVSSVVWISGASGGIPASWSRGESRQRSASRVSFKPGSPSIGRGLQW